MEIVNGQEVISGAFLLECNSEFKVNTYTADQVLTVNQTGQLIVSNSSSNLVYTLPVAAAADVGKWFTFANINTGRLTIGPGTGGQINNGTATTGTFYSDTDNTASCIIKCVAANKWQVISANGIWSTT